MSPRLNFEVRLYSETATERDWLAIAKRIAKAAKGRRKDAEARVFAGNEHVTTKRDGTFNHSIQTCTHASLPLRR